MDRHSCEYDVSDFSRETHPCPYPETVEERMEKYRNKGYHRYMIVVFVGIFVSMITMSVVVHMWCEDLFDDIDDEKSCEKCIDRKGSFFE